MSSRKKIPLAIYELPLDQKRVIATTFLTAQFLSELFNTVTDDPDSLAFQEQIKDALSELMASHLCHKGMISEIRVNLILLKMLTVAKKVD
jgi:hypothetical protein